MKKIFLALALLASMQFAGAQILPKYAGVAKGNAEVAQANADNPKKATKYATWLKLAQSYFDAYTACYGNGWVGASRQDVALLMKDEQPISVEEVTIQGVTFKKEKFQINDYYYDATDHIAMIIVTDPIYEDALERSLAAYKKAYSLDSKKADEIKEGIQKIVEKYNNEAYDWYNFDDMEKSSKAFDLAAKAAATDPLNKVDTNAIYSSGVTALIAGNLEDAKGKLDKCREYNFTKDGELFSRLGVIYDKLAEKAGNPQDSLAMKVKSKDIMEEGFTKYPSNQGILIGLINYYINSGENTDRLFELLEGAKKNDPGNASLYYVEGNIHEKLGNREAALKAYEKCGEIDPNYVYGYIGMGLYYYEKAVEVSTKAQDELDDNKYEAMIKESTEALKNCIEPFEKAFGMVEDESLKANIAVYLKNACYRFITESDDYKAKYDKYSAASAN